MRLCVLTSRGDDGTYVAVCPSLPGCITRARTHREVLTRHRDAVIGYLASVGNTAEERVEFDVVNERRNAAIRRMQGDENIFGRRENGLNFERSGVR